MESLYLIVGLGNPGREYFGTRHNVGFALVDALARSWGGTWRLEKKFSARVARIDRGGRSLWLCQPQTYMNASGEAVARVAGFYRVPAGRLLVAVDDADLPLGEIRLRPSGSSGGHHGLESVEQHLGTREYARLRLGIGRSAGAREITNHVLGRFNSTEAAVAARVLDVASRQVESWLDAGIQTAMSQFNGVVDPGDERKAQ